MHDAVVIGAGIGGLTCAAKLAKSGLRVLVLEKNPHIGGTSYIFRRGGYSFPMGPLSIGFPGRVKAFLNELGIQAGVKFKRNHFQLMTPDLDIVYSRPISILKDDLKQVYPEESAAIDSIMAEIENIIRLTKNMDRWHPDFLAGLKKKKAVENLSFSDKKKMAAIKKAAGLSSREILDRSIDNIHLRNLIGSQGTYQDSRERPARALRLNRSRRNRHAPDLSGLGAEISRVDRGLDMVRGTGLHSAGKAFDRDSDPESVDGGDLCSQRTLPWRCFHGHAHGWPRRGHGLGSTDRNRPMIISKCDASRLCGGDSMTSWRGAGRGFPYPARD